MQTTILVRGHLVGPTTIELEQPIEQMSGAVEVYVRAAEALGARESLLEFINRLPTGTRSKDQIDAQIEEERKSWEK
jgi:hypothetical protein